MQSKAWPALAAVILAAVFLIVATPGTGVAQQPATFKTRLSPVALDTPMVATVTGSGSATAVLAGTKLTITGEYQDMKSPATVAQIHSSPVTGVRGPVLFDLTVDKAPNGKISGSFNLTAEQADALRKGRLYIQIHSEKAPDGNLWGWLLP